MGSEKVCGPIIEVAVVDLKNDNDPNLKLKRYYGIEKVKWQLECTGATFKVPPRWCAPCARRRRKQKIKIWGLSRGTCRTTAQRSVRWDLCLHSFAAWSDQAQLDWLSRTARRRPLLRLPLCPAAAAPSPASTPSTPCSGGLLESAPGGSLSRTADAAGKDTLAPAPPRPICRPRLRFAAAATARTLLAPPAWDKARFRSAAALPSLGLVVGLCRGSFILRRRKDPTAFPPPSLPCIVPPPLGTSRFPLRCCRTSRG